MPIFGLSNSVGKTSGLPSGGAAFAVDSYFIAGEFDNTIVKVTADGTGSEFHDYGSLQPRGVAWDWDNDTLFGLIGDTGGRSADKFTDLDESTSIIGVADTLADPTGDWMGVAFYWNNDIYWFSQSTAGMMKIDAALTTGSVLFTSQPLLFGTYWSPDDEVYAIETSGTYELWTGELDGTSFADSGGNFTGFLHSIIGVPATKTGGNKYLFVANRQTGSIDRYDRPTGLNRLVWLDMTVASSIKLFPTSVQYDFANDRIVFLGHPNGGTGVMGLYSIPMQEGAQAEGNITLICDLSTLLSGLSGPTTGQDLTIRFTGDPTSYMVDA